MQGSCAGDESASCASYAAGSQSSFLFVRWPMSFASTSLCAASDIDTHMCCVCTRCLCVCVCVCVLVCACAHTCSLLCFMCVILRWTSQLLPHSKRVQFHSELYVLDHGNHYHHWIRRLVSANLARQSVRVRYHVHGTGVYVCLICTNVTHAYVCARLHIITLIL